LEENNINIFYKIKKSMYFIRIILMEYFGWIFKTHQRYNRYFSIVKPITPLDYIWFLEYNTLLFLIKIKLSNSIQYSVFLVKNNFIYNNVTSSFSRWSYLTINSYTQFIISEWSYFSTIKFISRLNEFIKNISYFYKIKLNLSLNNNIKKIFCIKNYYRLKLMFFKYLECDYKIMTFILLPLKSSKLYYNYVMLNWFNYWNHKIANWKYLT
jgi:hypothetical protein